MSLHKNQKMFMGLNMSELEVSVGERARNPMGE